jgi:GST-like protein
MIKLYGCGSPNVFKVMLMLAELDMPYEFETVSLYDGSLRKPEFLAMNPNGRLPVLVDDGMPVFESGAILIHLAEKSGRFLPACGPERSAVIQWLMWQMGGVGPMFGQALHFRYIQPDGNDYARGRYAREVERLYDVAESRLTAVPWLGGADYSIADMAAYPWLGRYPATLGLDMSGRPAVRDWIARVEARPGWQSVEPTARTMFKAGIAAQQEATQEELDRFFGRAGS